MSTSTIRVGYDLSICAFNAAGNARYTKSLYAALKGMAGEQHIDLIPLGMPDFLKSTQTGLKRKVVVAYWEFVHAPRMLNALCRKYRCDLLHVTVPMPLRQVCCPVVATIHDMAPFVFPQWFPERMSRRLRSWTINTLSQAQHVIADSVSTSKDVICFFTNAPPCTVVHLASSLKSSNDEGETKISPSDEYVLTVGTLEPRKNLHRVLEAYSQLVRRLTNVPRLIVVGGQGWLKEDLPQLLEQLDIAGCVQLAGRVTDQELQALYAGASMLVYVSLYEGFGFPILEAMAAGCPVITSNCSSMPEVAGNAGMLVDPTNTDQIVSAMETLLGNPARRQAMREAGLLQASQFTWQRAAQQTIDVYKDVLK